MIPKLYDSFDLTSNRRGGVDYLGRITSCSKCLCTETRRGEYTLELETSLNDPTAGALISQRIVAVKPNPHDPVQHFEIQNTERSLSGTIRASAKHVKNFACQFLSEGSISYTDNPDVFNLTPEGVWDKLFDSAYPYITDPCPFNFSSDITDTAGFFLGFNEPTLLGDIFGGANGSMIDMFGGEFHYDNYDIVFNSRRGISSNYRLRYGQNISDANQNESCLQTYSHVLPYGSISREDGRYIYLYSPLYEIPNNECKTKKVFILDCSDAAKDIQVGLQSERYDAARAAMTAYAQRYASSNGIGKTDISIDVTTVAELEAMKQLGLCDTVKVILDKFGITTTAKITSVTYNCLLERWEKMTVGVAPVSLADLILDKKRYNL